MPILRDVDTGLPHHAATLFVLATIRARGLASATIEQALRAILVAQTYFDQRQIDLDARLDNGQFLSPAEVDGLAQTCSLKLEYIREDVKLRAQGSTKSSRVVSLDKARMVRLGPVADAYVDRGSAAIRLHYISEYLEWRVQRQLGKGPTHSSYQPLQAVYENRLKSLKDLSFASRRRNETDARQGLSPEDRNEVLRIVDPMSADNPFISGHVRVRNQLIVHLLMRLGIRAGELLGLRCSDVNFTRQELLVPRRADDVTDPRKREPNTKTRARIIPLHPHLLAATRDYIVQYRSKEGQSRKHEFLLVADGTGAPMSRSALAKVLLTVKNAPGMPAKLSPHLFRHTWNDSFSDLADRKGLSSDEEEKFRSELMGWSQGSKMAATYTRRHIRRKSNEASIALQNHLIKPN